MSGPGDWKRPDARYLLASFPMAVLLIAPDLTVAGVNPAAEQLSGQGARRMLGRKVSTVIDFEPRVAESLGEGAGQLFARDSVVRIGAGRPRRLDVMLAPVVHCPGWQLLTLHETVGVEALAREGAGAGGDAAPLRAPAVLAHEIKNPLAGIRGAAQLLARTVPESDLALTGLITEEVDRIAKLIDQMQSLTSRNAEAAAPCNLHEAVRRAEAVLQASSALGTLRVEEEFDPSLPLVLCGCDALVQVVLNLLTNAREAATASKRPRLVIRTRFASGIFLHGARGEAPLRLPIELRISDNGPGIPEDLREHIFDPFVTGKKQGQGLGLALVQKLVREMHGRITHDRDETTGLTHFRLHLPVAEEARSSAKTASAAAA